MQSLSLTRRDALLGTAASLAFLQPKGHAQEHEKNAKRSLSSAKRDTISLRDGSTMYYKDWGAGRPIVFSHGWPLTSDAWDAQMLFFGQRGFRVIAHDRRGHGRSTQTWDGNDIDTYADDLSELFEALNLKDAVMVGHSTGGGEVVRYLARRGVSRVSKAVLISAIPPLMLKTAANPEGLPLKVFDDIRGGVAGNRSQFYKDLALPFFGFNRPNTPHIEGTIDHFWWMGMSGGIKPQYDCVRAFSETDFTNDLPKISIPTLVLHGDDDQVVPLSDSAILTAKQIKQATLKVYPGFPHGMPILHSDVINEDILSFLSK